MKPPYTLIQASPRIKSSGGCQSRSGAAYTRCQSRSSGGSVSYARLILDVKVVAKQLTKPLLLLQCLDGLIQ